jgi:hypothetical protein
VTGDPDEPIDSSEEERTDDRRRTRLEGFWLHTSAAMPPWCRRRREG